MDFNDIEVERAIEEHYCPWLIATDERTDLERKWDDDDRGHAIDRAAEREEAKW